eukprot:GEMP01028830.1.p1 GENE.GEMP01028830.1~~GEMP01028830.1.p1  ORF type:complete len:233 (+),score=46.17 GEMP01028830.1:114-812(+)
MGFQFKDGDWCDYDGDIDATLKAAYLARYSTCHFQHGQCHYDVNFPQMTQTNSLSGHTRDIRLQSSRRYSCPKAPPGRTMTVKVPLHVVPGCIMYVTHPDGGDIAVQVPSNALSGSLLMVPIPDHLPMQSLPSAPPVDGATCRDMGTHSADSIETVSDTRPPPRKRGMSTGAKVVTGVGITVGVLGAGAITGAVLIDQGVFSLHDVGDFFVDAGVGIAAAFEELGDEIVGLF